MSGLRVAIVGCGLIGAKRAGALGEEDSLIACHDVSAQAAERLAAEFGCRVCNTLDELLQAGCDVVVVATPHDQLAGIAELALQGGAHVLVEKPAGISSAQMDRLIECERESGRLVKVGFNHRFHPGIARAAEEVHSGRHGELMHLRGRYGHGGRIGYDREWRADPARSGGGELIDQGMHLLDLTHRIAGPLPLHSALLRTHFWDTPAEDNAALILGEAQSRTAPWAMLHVTWTEWFSLEIYCRTAKIQVDGLVRSYGPQRLRIYRMGPELGPPELEEVEYPNEDHSWEREWASFSRAIEANDATLLNGDLRDARYAWTQIEAAYAAGPYAPMRAGIGG
ncbi:MAG: Gfo/Idh/MocA family protein [Solirubrobacteraceae bacterium]